MKSGEYRRPRFDAWPSACVAALWIALVALLGVTGRAGEDDSYYLTAWPYGAVAWVQTISLRVADFTDRLTRTAEYAFTFWGFKPPTPPKSWEHPEENPTKFSMTGLPQIRKKDPSTAKMWLLDPLVWEGEQIYPLLVIAFRDQAAMERSLHNTSIEASFASNAAAIRGAELWLRTLLGCPRIVLCDVNESAAALVHEFAHWLCCEWYERVGGHGFYHAPNFILEGMAEVTAGQFRSVSRRDDDYVGKWLQSNRLADGVYGDDKYVIGESFVRYLVDVLTPEGFFETLGDWASRPAELIEEYEPGWRASIGLPRECITE